MSLFKKSFSLKFLKNSIPYSRPVSQPIAEVVQLTLVAERALPEGLLRRRAVALVDVALVAVALECVTLLRLWVFAGSVLAPGQGHAAVAQVTLPGGGRMEHSKELINQGRNSLLKHSSSLGLF